MLPMYFGQLVSAGFLLKNRLQACLRFDALTLLCGINGKKVSFVPAHIQERIGWTQKQFQKPRHLRGLLAQFEIRRSTQDLPRPCDPH